jgi:hypothetical protein
MSSNGVNFKDSCFDELYESMQVSKNALHVTFWIEQPLQA